jgi:hypothetical protein
MRLRPAAPSHDLETELLRKGVMALSAGRHVCADCERTPLVGERVHHYESGRVCCELCRRRRREEPLRSELVRSAEHGHAVKLTERRAA